MSNSKNKISNTYLSFILKQEMFAVDVHMVLEVMQRRRITPVPDSPDYIKGVIHFRGDIIPVIETRTKIGLENRDDSEKYVIIVLEFETETDSMIIGAKVDKVFDVISFPAKDLLPIPKMTGEINPYYLQGVARNGEEFIMLLDSIKTFDTEFAVQGI